MIQNCFFVQQASSLAWLNTGLQKFETISPKRQGNTVSKFQDTSGQSNVCYTHDADVKFFNIFNLNF